MAFISKAATEIARNQTGIAEATVSFQMTEEYLESMQKVGGLQVVGFIILSCVVLFMILGYTTEKTFLFGREFYSD
jgi:hypothetical protein